MRTAGPRCAGVAVIGLGILFAGSQVSGLDRAEAEPLFRDASRESGLPQFGPTLGVIALDLNGDGTLELILNRHDDGLPPVAWQIEPLRFEIGSLAADDPGVRDHHSTTAMDLDGDGRPELYLGVGAAHGSGWGPKALLTMVQDRWVDVAPRLGVTDPCGRGRSALFLNLAGTPALDLVVLNFRTSPRVFADFVLDRPPEDVVPMVWPEIPLAPPDPPDGVEPASGESRAIANYIAHLIPGYLLDETRPMYIAWGDRAKAYAGDGSDGLVRLGEWAATQSFLRRPTHAVIADLDGDLRNDLYLVFGDGPPRSSAAYHNDLLLQRAPGELEPASYEDGALLDGTGHRVHAADFDLDGNLDLLVLRRRDPMRDREPALLRGLGEGRFEDMSEAWGLAGFRGGVSQDALVCDLDRDGDLDLVLAQGDHNMREASGGFRVYENAAGGGGAHSIQFELAGGDQSNAAAFGARLRLHAGARVWIRDHWPTQVDGSAVALPVHFGLGAETVVDSVSIDWPSGHREMARDLRADGIWKWREGEPPRHER